MDTVATLEVRFYTRSWCRRQCYNLFSKESIMVEFYRGKVYYPFVNQLEKRNINLMVKALKLLVGWLHIPIKANKIWRGYVDEKSLKLSAANI